MVKLKSLKSYKKYIIYLTVQKFKFKRLLTKDRSETSSLEYIIITTNYTFFLYYANTCFCVLTD